MSDMLATIVPKSDQLNADDLIGKNMTIQITGLSIAMGDQPVSLNFEGDNGKPYKPGKSMRRVLVNAWGADGKSYVGRYLTLYRDEKVMFGGMSVGGIRISHMSHIDNAITMALTASKANKKPFTVKPLVLEGTFSLAEIEDLKAGGAIESEKGAGALKTWWISLGGSKQKHLGAEFLAQLKTTATQADEQLKIWEEIEKSSNKDLEKINESF